MAEIRCYVDSCEHWANQMCQAQAIEVRSEDEQKTPKRSDHTMCATFKPPGT